MGLKKKKESTNLKTYHLKLLSQSSKKKDKVLRKPRALIGHHQKGQYYALWNSQKKREKGAESLFEEMIAKTIPNLGEENVHSDSRSPVD